MFLLNWCKNLRAHFGMYRKRAGVWTPGSPLRCAPALEEIQQSLWFFSSSKVSIWTSSYGRVCQFCLFSNQNAGFLDHQNLSIKPLISLRENCPDTEFFWSVFSRIQIVNLRIQSKYGPEKTPQGYDQKRKLFRTNGFVLAHLSAKKSLHWITNGKGFSTLVSHDFNMTSFSPCCHDWLACIYFCACICLLSPIFCLVCCCLFVEQLLPFHWDIGDIV